MHIYWRILSYARSYTFVPKYMLITVLGVIFGALNFTLLAPIFSVLFNSVPENISQNLQEPIFSFNLSYFKDLFNYYFALIIVKYGKVEALQFVCVIVAVSVLFANIFRFWSFKIINDVKAVTISNLRNHVFDHLLSLHQAYFSSKQKGDLMSRITSDVQEIEYSVHTTLKSIFKEPLTIIVYFGVLIYTSWELTIFTIIFLPISGGIIAEVTKKLRKQGTESQELIGKIFSVIDESIQGLKVIRAFGAERFVENKFRKTNADYAKVSSSMENRKDMASPLSEFLGVLVVVSILIYGGTLVLRGESDLTAADFLTYIVVFSQILPAAKSVSSSITNLQRGLASGERVFKIIDTPSEIKNSPNAIQITDFSDKITFQNVSFAYQEREVLKNINLEIPKGKTVALVGMSGGGKSTLADLIPRFYDCTAGKILLDNKNITEIDLKSLRSLMGMVTQESLLFNDSIFNNIAFGMENISEDQVIQAAKIANAHDFILQTENGYQSNVGDRGTKLSGGQRQRLSIARAILKNPSILILDEATSALDSESEKLVQDALAKLMQNRTALVIAHRLSTIQNADLIVVLNEGEIAEQGTHEELIDKNGIYSKLSAMQGIEN